MKTLQISLILILASADRSSLAAEPQYELKIKPSRRVNAVLATKIKAPKLKANEWIFYVPDPPSLAGQEVHEAKLSPESRRVKELSDAHQSILLTRVKVKADAPKDAIEFKAEYDVTLRSRKLVRLPAGRKGPASAPPSAEEKKLALSPSKEYDFKAKEFRDWLIDHGLNRKPDEAEVDYGRRVFSFIKSNYQYEYTETLDRRASRVCTHRRSDCGGLSVLFIAILRANGMPSRMLVGRWASSEKAGDKVGGIPYAQQHAKAEFFAEGVGWVPVDLASAVLYDKTPEGLVFFGNDEGDFLVMHVDGDLVLDTIHFGKETVEVLQGGAVWVTGSGSMEGFTQDENWQVRKVAR